MVAAAGGNSATLLATVDGEPAGARHVGGAGGLAVDSGQQETPVAGGDEVVPPATLHRDGLRVVSRHARLESLCSNGVHLSKGGKVGEGI
jgi:hypothetical protein